MSEIEDEVVSLPDATEQKGTSEEATMPSDSVQDIVNFSDLREEISADTDAVPAKDSCCQVICHISLPNLLFYFF